MSSHREQSPEHMESQSQNKSSSLSYLKPPLQLQQEDQSQTKRKFPPDAEKQSNVRKNLMTNRRKGKNIQDQSIYDGIYLYKPGMELPHLYHFLNQSIKIIVASEYLKRNNPQLLKRNVYGTDTYTANSDTVCILVHSGMINLNTFANKKFQGIQLTCKVTKPKKNIIGVFKNNIMSRSVKGYNGSALKPQSIKNLYSLGQIQLLERYASNMHIPIGKHRVKSKPKNICSINPIPQTHIAFNMHNQPAYKYSLFNLADKGYEKNQFLIKKLDNMVLYLETSDRKKYQLSKKILKQYFDTYTFSRILHPEKTDNEFMNKQKSPLADDMLQKIEEQLQWQEIKWGNESVQVKGKLYGGLKTFKFYKKEK